MSKLASSPWPVHHHNINSSSSSNNNDYHDWDSFPPNVKRKYFSSLERLRFAQASATRPKTSLGQTNGIVKGSMSPKSLRPSLARRNSSYFKNLDLLRSRNKTPSPTSDTFSQSDAQWFLRLPDKVQKQHFTPEERWLLSGHQEIVLPDALDERVFRSFSQQSREDERSLPTLRPSSSSSASSITTFDAEDLHTDSAIAMDDADFDGFRWIENDDDHDLASTLDDYHTFVNTTAEANAKSNKRHPSFRRALSMTSLPFGPTNTTSVPKPILKKPLTNTPNPASPSTTTTTSIVPQLPPLKITSHKRHSSSRPHLLPIHHNNNQNPISNPGRTSIDPQATHYTDPSARLKLRVYLASPQKFDEAIEFGFPSMEDKENMPLARPSFSRPSLSRNPNTAPAGKTFLDDSNPSIFDALDDRDDDDNDTASSLPERNSPHTPVDSHFTDTYLLSPSEAPSSAGSTRFPRTRPTARSNMEYEEPYKGQVMGGGREMTLKMTLTRPDLRGDEKALYDSSNGGEDPLALEQLGTDGGSGDIWDTCPPVQSGVLKRAWRKVSGRTGA